MRTATTGARAAGDDMLKVGGIWVSPVEVENCIMEHPAVLEVAVVGKDDEKGLTKPKAFVVLKDGKKGVGGSGEGDETVGPRPDGQVQVPPVDRVRQGASEELHGQDTEIQAEVGLA